MSPLDSVIHKRFRLRTPTMVVAEQAAHGTAVMIPAGAELFAIEMCAGDHARVGEKIVVEWRGERYCMFLVDLQERGECVQSAREF